MRHLYALIAFPVLGLPLLAQQPAHREDQIDAAHRGLYQTKQDPKKTASSVTEQVAPARAGLAAKTGPIVRKNFIDDQSVLTFGTGVAVWAAASVTVENTARIARLISRRCDMLPSFRGKLALRAD